MGLSHLWMRRQLRVKRVKRATREGIRVARNWVEGVVKERGKRRALLAMRAAVRRDFCR